MMVRFVGYLQFGSIHEHWQLAMDLFNRRMTWLCYAPAGILLVSSIALYWLSPGSFPRWTIISIILLTAVSVSTTLFVVSPIHISLPETGFTDAVQSRLTSLSSYLQLLPSLAVVVLAMVLLNNYLGDAKPLGRWLFILAFALTFYTAGTNYVETLIYYPMWSVIGGRDWAAFKGSGGTHFFKVYLIPAYLPIIALILLNWWRPVEIPKLYVNISLLCNLFILAASAIYFVPKIQMKLEENYSRQLIDDLIKYQFPLRGIAEIVDFVAMGFMFLKIGQYKKLTERTISTTA